MTSNKNWSLAHVALLVCACAGACKSKPSEQGTAAQSTAAQGTAAQGTAAQGTAGQGSGSASMSLAVAEPAPELRARMDEVAASVDETTWSFKSAPKPEEAAPLALALIKAEKGDAVTGAALAVLGKSLKSTASLSDEVVEVVLRQIASTTARLAARAISAVTPVLGNGRASERLIEAIVQAADKPEFRESKGRFVILEALELSSPMIRKRHFQQLAISSLNASEPYAVIAALQLLDDEKQAPKRDAKVEAAVLPLTQHSDPSVRGVALRLLGRVGTKLNDEVGSRLVAGLKDKAPFVRAEAAKGLGFFDQPGSEAALVPLLDDLADDRLQYYAATFEEGTPLRALSGSYWPHVADAAQWAFVKLVPSGPRVEGAKPADVPGSLKANAKVLRVWYAKNKHSLQSAQKAKSAASAAQPAPGQGSTKTVAAPK